MDNPRTNQTTPTPLAMRIFPQILALVQAVSTGSSQQLNPHHVKSSLHGEHLVAEPLSGVPRHETREQGTSRHQDPRAE